MRLFYIRFDKLLAILGCLLGIPVVILTIIGKLLPIYLLIVFTVVISCILYLLKGEGFHISPVQYGAQKKRSVLPIAYYILFSLGLSVLYISDILYVRPALYYFTILAMCFIIVLQITSVNSANSSGILIQIIALGMNIRLTQLFIYPSLVGIDPFWHQMFTSLILEEGSIPAGYTYSGLPLMHIYIAITTYLTECGYKAASAVTIPFVQVLITTILIYTLGNKIIDRRVGLLGALLFILSDWSINLGFAVVPNTFAGIFATILIYLMIIPLSSVQPRGVLWSIIISTVILCVALIASHALTAAWFAIVIICIWASTVFYSVTDLKSNRTQYSKSYNRLSIFIVLFSVLLLSWWMHASGHIHGLVDVARWVLSVSVEEIKQTFPTNVQEYLMGLPLQEQTVINLGFFLYCGLSLIGCFYLISRSKGVKGFTFAATGMLTLFIGFIAQLSALINVAQRFWYFAEILLSIPLALSLVLVTERNGSINKILIGTTSCVIIGFMLMSPSVSYDNTALTPHYSVRYGLFMSELTAMDTVDSRFDDVRCLSDGYYIAVHNHLNLGGNAWESLDWQLATKSFNLERGTLVMLRTEVTSKPVLCLSTIYKLDYSPTGCLEDTGYSTVYDIGTVVGYIRFSKNFQC